MRLEKGSKISSRSSSRRNLIRRSSYAWYPGAPGFVRNTLNAHKCDVIMGFPQGNDFAQVTNPYYRTSYALIFKPGSGIDAVELLMIRS